MFDTAMQGVYVLEAPDMLQPFLVPESELGTFIETERKQGQRVEETSIFDRITPQQK